MEFGDVSFAGRKLKALSQEILTVLKGQLTALQKIQEDQSD
jgi:hypothetical protein